MEDEVGQARTRLAQQTVPSAVWCMRMLASNSNLTLDRLAAAFKVSVAELRMHLQSDVDANTLEVQVTPFRNARHVVPVKEKGKEAKPVRKLSNGSRFTGKYKGVTFQCEVVNGYVKYAGTSYSSLSAAGCAATGRSTCNGWDFWRRVN